MSELPEVINLLLVEDDEDDYMFTREYLDEVPGQTYSITWVSNYTEGLRTIGSQAFDVTLVDYRIDTGTGLEFIRMLRARNIDCPAILLTGVRSREVDIAAQQAGASDYLVKGSLNAEILERSIRYAIAHASRRRVLDSVLANIDAGVIALDAHDGVMLMNSAARSIVGLDDVGTLAPENSIGIFSNVRRFLGESPYPSKVFDARGREYYLRSMPLANEGKLVILREPPGARPDAANVTAVSTASVIDGGLSDASTGAIYSWMEKILTASRQLAQARTTSSWQQFAAELRHSGRRLVAQVNDLQKLNAEGDDARVRAMTPTPAQPDSRGGGSTGRADAASEAAANPEPARRKTVVIA
ncbi:MAG: response regulator [Pseudomonadota bacterium]